MELLTLLKGNIPELSAAAVFVLFLVQMYLNNQRDRRKQDNDNDNAKAYTALNTSLMERLKIVEADIKELRTENATLKVENERLRSKLVVMESAHQDAPIPMWLKDKNGVMLAVNAAYEAEFLLPLGKNIGDYVGHTDYDVWPDEVAAEFIRNDLHVQSTMSVWLGTEEVPTPDGKVTYGIMKYPRKEGNFLIGIAGIAIPHRLLTEITLDG